MNTKVRVSEPADMLTIQLRVSEPADMLTIQLPVSQPADVNNTPHVSEAIHMQTQLLVRGCRCQQYNPVFLRLHRRKHHHKLRVSELIPTPTIQQTARF
jgi:hypothetical protein